MELAKSIDRRAVTVMETAQSTPTKTNLSSAFAEKFGECSYTATANPAVPKLEKAIRNIQLQIRKDPMDDAFRILEYWRSQRSQYPELWSIAKIVFAAPASQCTVERDFSTYNELYKSSRTNLSEENLNSTLFVALNNNLIDRVPMDPAGPILSDE